MREANKVAGGEVYFSDLQVSWDLMDGNGDYVCTVELDHLEATLLTPLCGSHRHTIFERDLIRDETTMVPNGGYEPTVPHNEIGVSRADLRLAAEVRINTSFKIQKNLHAVVGCTDGLDSD